MNTATHTRTRTRITALTVTAALALSVTACSSDIDGVADQTTPSTVAPGSDSDTPEPTQAGDVENTDTRADDTVDAGEAGAGPDYVPDPDNNDATGSAPTVDDNGIPAPTGNHGDAITPAGSNNFGITPDSNRVFGPATVVRIADGDTVIVDLDGEKLTVQMIGVDAPDHDSPYAERATARTTEMLPVNSTVILELDPTQGLSDDSGRRPAYIWTLVDGEVHTLANIQLIAAGLATERMPDNDKSYVHRSEFLAAQDAAEKNSLALWS